MQRMKGVAWAAMFGLGLAACSEETEDALTEIETLSAEAEAEEDAAKAEAEAEAKASEADTSDDSLAEDKAAIETFIASLFAGYTPNGSGPPLDTPSAVYEPQLAGAVAALQRQSDESGELIDALSYDPICNCQDFDTITHTVNSVALNGKRASAKVGVTNFGETRERTFELMLTDAGWRSL